MFRLAVAAALGLTALGAVITLVLVQSGSGPFRWESVFAAALAVVALLASCAALAFAVAAMRHAAKLRSDIVLLARSIDIALKDVVARTDREAATFEDMANIVSREIEGLSERLSARQDAPAGEAAGSGNVVPYPSVRRVRDRTAAESDPPPPVDPSAIEAACTKAIAAGVVDISLQPIVSVARGSAAGFEVFASLPLENGQRFDLRRPSQLARPDLAAFERILLTTALQAGRRKLGADSVKMPLHVAISEALLSDSKELDAVMDILRFYPDLARSFVLSVPAALLDAPGRLSQPLRLFAERSVQLAVEGWNAAEDTALPADLSMMKIPTNRLTDRKKSRRGHMPASAILDRATASNISVVATDVASDEEAVALVDLGIDLMSGPRFGGPKRFKPDGGQPGKLALI